MLALGSSYTRMINRSVLVLRLYCVRSASVVYSSCFVYSIVVGWYCSCVAIVLYSCRIRCVSHVVKLVFVFALIKYCIGFVVVLYSFRHHLASYVFVLSSYCSNRVFYSISVSCSYCTHIKLILD